MSKTLPGEDGLLYRTLEVDAMALWNQHGLEITRIELERDAYTGEWEWVIRAKEKK